MLYNRYRIQLNRANKWKSDYFAIKSTLDRERNNADKLPFDKEWVNDTSSWSKVNI